MLQSAVRASKSDDNENFTRQGSLRRVLPKETNKEIFARQNEDINKFYKLIHQEYIILAEYEMVISEKLKGVYAIPSRQNPFVWFGVIFIRSGLYENGVFRFNVTLPDDFPNSDHPKVIFQSDIYHPVINSETNEVHLFDGFPVWKRRENHVWQILKYLQWIFYNFNASLAHGIDKEAVQLYKTNTDEFKEKVALCVKTSQERLYDPPETDDKHYITFEKYVSDIHDGVREKMLTKPSEERLAKKGLSWVAPGSFKPLSRAQSDSEDES